MKVQAGAIGLAGRRARGETNPIFMGPDGKLCIFQTSSMFL